MKAALVTLGLFISILLPFAWKVHSPAAEKQYQSACIDPVRDATQEADQDPIERLLRTKACPRCQLEEEPARLQGAKLPGANLIGAELRGSNLGGADLTKANLSNAHLRVAVLHRARLDEACLVMARMQGTNLKQASLLNADLTGAVLIGTDLADADLRSANLKKTLFEPASVPSGDLLVDVAGLKSLLWTDSPSGIIRLRNSLKEAGFRDQEREVTYALMHGFTEKKLNGESTFRSRIEGLLQYFFFEMTSDWGMSPARPLWILVELIFVFACFHTFALAFPSPASAVWRVWDKDRLLQDRGIDVPEQLLVRNLTLPFYALRFSVLSAFYIGWRDLNVGTWIARIFPGEYALRGTGWVRTIAGMQSIISVYLLALAVLTYFGRPFE